MKYIKGQNREQTSLFPLSLNDAVEAENEVRLIDVFVDNLNLKEFGFKTEFMENLPRRQAGGRPAYHPSDLLKLFIYGYLNKIRSSRSLEKECKRNIEVLWLLKCLKPDHNTIANFRRDNPKAIKKVFRKTVEIAKYFNLIGGTLIAGDSTKLRAQNSKKNNFNQKKIQRHLEYIENKLAEYEKALSVSDGDNKKQVEKEIEKHHKRKENYKQLEKQLKESGQPQISTSDPDSRQMIIRNNITEVAYNVQTTVDAKNKIPVDYKLTNHNDSKAMGNMLQRAKTILRSNQFIALYDKGYHTGSEFAIADKLGIETLVAIPGNPRSSEAPDPRYNVENFTFDNQNDCYICPQGHILKSNGSWYNAANNAYRFRQFKTSACKKCNVRGLCTASKRNGKVVQRSEFTQALEQNKIRVENNKELYRKRQAIVEHPYGTLKRQWGFSYVMTKKTIERASSDVGLMFTAYNLRRIINIIGFKELIKHLEYFSSYFYALFAFIKLILKPVGDISIINREYFLKTEQC